MPSGAKGNVMTKDETEPRQLPNTTPEKPSTFLRWLGVVPLLMGILVVGWPSFRGQALAEPLYKLKVDLPLITRLAFAWFGVFPTVFWAWLPVSGLLCWCYFAWAARTRQRLLALNVIVFLVTLALFLLLVIGSLLPIIKISEALRKH